MCIKELELNMNIESKFLSETFLISHFIFHMPLI